MIKSKKDEIILDMDKVVVTVNSPVNRGSVAQQHGQRFQDLNAFCTQVNEKLKAEQEKMSKLEPSLKDCSFSFIFYISSKKIHSVVSKGPTVASMVKLLNLNHSMGSEEFDSIVCKIAEIKSTYWVNTQNVDSMKKQVIGTYRAIQK